MWSYAPRKLAWVPFTTESTYLMLVQLLNFYIHKTKHLACQILKKHKSIIGKIWILQTEFPRTWAKWEFFVAFYDCVCEQMPTGGSVLSQSWGKGCGRVCGASEVKTAQRAPNSTWTALSKIIEDTPSTPQSWTQKILYRH